MWRVNRRRHITILLIVCLVVVAVDSSRVPFVAVGPLYWLVAGLYTVALLSGSRDVYRLATAALVSVSMLRPLLFWLDDGRIAPFGLNGAIATLAVATYMGRAPRGR